MRLWFLIACLIFGFLEQQAQAYEVGLGMGRASTCIDRPTQKDLCSIGATVSVRFGLNLWGKGYKPEAHEKASETQDYTPGMRSWWNGFQLDGKGLALLVVLVVVAVLVTTIAYAFIYPFSSRVDVGIVGNTGGQAESSQDFLLWRNEAGVYLRAFPSQHIPLYIYGSGIYSHQNYMLFDVSEDHNVLTKGIGLGFMSPTGGGVYLQGVWERSTLLDPNAKDLVEDSAKVKIFKNSAAAVIDGSHFELGYIWYL